MIFHIWFKALRCDFEGFSWRGGDAGKTTSQEAGRIDAATVPDVA